MSTKTTFKRIALVAVAALGFGTLSVAPSSAADVPAEGPFRTASFVTSPATATVGVAVTAIVKVGSSCINDGLDVGSGNNLQIFASYTTQIDAAPAGTNLAGNSVDVVNASGTATVPTGYTNTNSTTVRYASVEGNGYRNTIQASCTAATGPQTAYASIQFTPDVAGSYTVVVAPLGATTGAITWTVVASAPVVQLSTAYINTNLSAESTADASSLTFTSTASTTAKARLTVKQYSTTDTTTAATTAISKDVVIAISKGLVSKTNDYSAAAASVTTAAATASSNDYYVFANGTVGSASLTVTVGGTLVSTKTITFQGAATKLTATLTTGQKTWIAPTQTTTLTVASLDSAGGASSNTPTITATSSNTAVATVVATSNTLVTITGVAAGTAVITVADSGAIATSATYTVTVTAATTSATLPTLTFDKAEYAAGELMTITIAANAADNASFAAFTANPTVSVNVVTVTNPFTSGAVSLVAGKATWTAYAPITPGPVVITATSGAGSSATAATVTASATVISDGVAQAAVDAAAEATDAANAATDAANAAAEAADAATAAAQDAADAVAALSTSVSAMIDALKKQITALTNLVIKIQKKVKA